MKTVYFLETIAASDLKFGRSRHQIEYMKICAVLEISDCPTRVEITSDKLNFTAGCSPDNLKIWFIFCPFLSILTY